MMEGRRAGSKDRHSSLSNLNAPKLRSVSKNGGGENFVMDRCGLPCIPSLKGRENMHYISLQHNLVVRIDSLIHFPTLMVLNLYDNKIERISGLDTLHCLRVLMLGKNRIKRIEGLDALSNLDILDLHGNQINMMANLSHLSCLRVLNLAANSLKKLSSLEGLVSLEELNLKRNRICKITPEICKAKKLQRLFLSNNDLRHLDDISPLAQLTSLRELTLDGNTLTLNASYVLHTVGSLTCLTMLDHNVICPSLRHEATVWSASNIQQDEMKQPQVTVHNRNLSASTVRFVRETAVVRPMSLSVENGRVHAEEMPGESVSVVATTPVTAAVVNKESAMKKSFRRIAFSALVCNTNQAVSSSGSKPVFQFNVRPPTADMRRCDENAAKVNFHLDVSDLESSSSWNSEESDSETSNSFLKPKSSCLSSKRRHYPNKFHQKLSATIGVNIKEQLRDLRIIVGDNEIHIGGLNVIRMLNQINWSTEEVDHIHCLVFNGLNLDHLSPYYSSLRAIFPNLHQFVFRNVLLPPSLNNITALMHLESRIWADWIHKLTIETPQQHDPSLGSWKLYAVYRFHLFGLRCINGQEVTLSNIHDAHDRYGILDLLIHQLLPACAIKKQMEQLCTRQNYINCARNADSPDGCGDQLQKKALRNIHQPLKEEKNVRNRSCHLRDLVDYGLRCAVKLSVLSHNWTRLLDEIIEQTHGEIQDEKNYKTSKLTLLKDRE